MTLTVRPLVSRTLPVGALLLGSGIGQFVVAMAIVQLHYPGYSLLTNYISDLGNTATSPWHVVFNVSIGILGGFSFVGLLLAWSAFPRGGTRVVGLSLLLLASVAAVLVGQFPENVDPSVHGTASLLVFAPGGLALLVLGAGMRANSSWAGGRAPSALLGAITLLSLAYFVPTQLAGTTWDPGLIERLIVAPILLWGFGVAVHLGRLPVRPRTVPAAHPRSDPRPRRPA